MFKKSVLIFVWASHTTACVILFCICFKLYDVMIVGKPCKGKPVFKVKDLNLWKYAMFFKQTFSFSFFFWRGDHFRLPNKYINQTLMQIFCNFSLIAHIKVESSFSLYIFRQTILLNHQRYFYFYDWCDFYVRNISKDIFMMSKTS